MGRRRKAKQLHKRPRKTPTKKEKAQEHTVDHAADHQNPGNGKELREDTAELHNYQTRKLTELYNLPDIALIKR